MWVIYAAVATVIYAAFIIAICRRLREVGEAMAAAPPPPPVVRPEPFIICTRDGTPTSIICDHDQDRARGLVLQTLAREGAAMRLNEGREA